MSAAGLRRCHAVGNSFGCQVAAELAVRHPSLVATLTLMGPTVDPAAPHLWQQALRLFRDMPHEPFRLWCNHLVDDFRAGPRFAAAAIRTMLDDKVREAERLSGEPFPKPLVLEIKHMVISHHGEYEYGSPKLPMTLEAVALHHLDNLDAKLASFSQLMIDCPNVESNWTQYHTNLGRKLYKGEAFKVAPSEGN